MSTTKSLPFKLPPRRGKTIKQSFSSSPSTYAAYDIFPVVIFSLRLSSIDHKELLIRLALKNESLLM